jgi:hypothetical protein
MIAFFMQSIDAMRIHPLHGVMSRPLRFLVPAVLAASTLGLSGCVGTIYDPMYSNRKNYFRPPEEKHEKEASAESILGALDKKAPAGAADATGLPPAGDIPGLPPAGMPDAGGAAAPAPAAPPAPAVPPPNN